MRSWTASLPLPESFRRWESKLVGTSPPHQSPTSGKFSRELVDGQVQGHFGPAFWRAFHIQLSAQQSRAVAHASETVVAALVARARWIEAVAIILNTDQDRRTDSGE